VQGIASLGPRLQGTQLRLVVDLADVVDVDVAVDVYNTIAAVTVAFRGILGLVAMPQMNYSTMP
jgi:hypothetical protein